MKLYCLDRVITDKEKESNVISIFAVVKVEILSMLSETVEINIGIWIADNYTRKGIGTFQNYDHVRATLTL